MLIKNKDLELEIKLEGAYISSFKYKSEDIFYPLTEIKINEGHKIRGGCHLCLPQFSDGQQFKLPAHGYARNCLWEIIEKSETALSLKLAKEPNQKMISGIFKNLNTIFKLWLSEDSLSLQLNLKTRVKIKFLLPPPFIHISN